MKLGLHVMVASLLFVGLAAGKIWEDGDTVIIDPSLPDDLSRFKREGVVVEELRSEDEDTVLIRSERCVTVRGKSGRCMTFRECYPLLSANDPSAIPSKFPTLNDPLADQLIETSGLCSGYQYRSDSTLFLQVARSEVLICCALQSRIAPPLPPLPPNSNITDPDIESKLGCGSLKTEQITVPEEPKLVDLGPQNSTNSTNNDGKIVGGEEAKRGEFPWIVAMMNSGREFCGGSLIDKTTILTAAHCVQHMGPSEVQKLTIQIGDHNIYGTADGRHEVRTAARILYHKDFSMQHLHHDVALVILNQPVSSTQYIKPVCLHSGSPNSDNQNGQVAGWGQLRDGGPQPSTLQKANVKIWSNADCSKRYGSNAPSGIGPGMVCSGGTGRDSCRGDSGGPLTFNGKALQVGIVSWGIGCGTYPGVYTRVQSYLPWISKNRRRSFAE